MSISREAGYVLLLNGSVYGEFTDFDAALLVAEQFATSNDSGKPTVFIVHGTKVKEV